VVAGHNEDVISRWSSGGAFGSVSCYKHEFEEYIIIMLKQTIVHFLRGSHLLTAAEKARYFLNVLVNRPANRRFIAEHPGVALPPLWLAYDAYSSTNYYWYWDSGSHAADCIVKYIPTVTTADDCSLLEWGCGPGRILRQLRNRLDASRVKIFGSDYNKASIAWCKEHLKGIAFLSNELLPPLNYKSGRFDLVYCASVLTHLPEPMFRPWLEELFRVLKPNGIALITLNGDRFISYLSREERESYERLGYANRGKVHEGSRLYMAYHSRRYVETVCGNDFKIVLHDSNPSHYLSGGQDVYLIQKI